MKKIGVIAIALVLALGALGASFALWSETLVIDATVQTGYIDVTFSELVCNDPPGTDDPTDPISEPPKDVADCIVTDVGGGVVEVLLDNVYPGYNPTLSMSVSNEGSVPVHLYVYLHFKQDTWVSDDSGLTWTFKEFCDVIHMEDCIDYHLDFDVEPIDPAGRTSADTDLDVHLTDINCEQLHYGGEPAKGSLEVLVKQDAKEEAMYAFNVVIVAQQWNEPPVAPTFP